MTCLISLIPDVTALNGMNSERVCVAIIRASVVLPQPGGPQKSIEPMSSRSICSRSGLPGAEEILLADELIERARAHAIG